MGCRQKGLKKVQRSVGIRTLLGRPVIINHGNSTDPFTKSLVSLDPRSKFMFRLLLG